MALLHRTPIYRGRIIELGVDSVQLPNGVTRDIELVRHPGASAIVPILPDQNVVLIRQFRHGADGYLLEVPAGTLEPGEAPERCAMRELQEETGYSCTRLEALGPIHISPGFTNELIHLFLAQDLTPGETARELDECMETLVIPMSQALRKIVAGEIVDGKSIAALWAAGARLGMLTW